MVTGVTATLSVPQDGEYIIRLLVVDSFGEQDIAKQLSMSAMWHRMLEMITAPLDPVQVGSEVAGFSAPFQRSWSRYLDSNLDLGRRHQL